jgi:hypothetical protein
MSGHIHIPSDPKAEAVASGLMRRRGVLPLDAINAAAANAGPAKHGNRTAEHQPCKCKCALPDAEIFDDTDETPEARAGCRECLERLNVDDRGEPYRRFPGDINTAEMQLQRIQNFAREEMRKLLDTLPKSTRERLERLAKRNPQQFNVEAQRLIAAHEVHSDHTPAARRQLQRAFIQELSPTLDAR